MKDNQKKVYLPQEFRPGNESNTGVSDRVAFMDSTVAIGAESGRIHSLKFHDDFAPADMRWWG